MTIENGCVTLHVPVSEAMQKRLEKLSEAQMVSIEQELRHCLGTLVVALEK